MTNISLLGDDCLRVNIEERENRHSVADHLRATDDWSEIVVGKHDITVQYEPYRTSPNDALLRLEKQLAQYSPLQKSPGTIFKIPVSLSDNDAPDLLRVAQYLEIASTALWDQLASLTLTIDMLGFTPGFAYMTGLPEAWEIERLESPRQSVPAGSIGIITGQCGLYALEGPGGWPIIGRALVPLFNRDASDSPLLYGANDRIRFLPKEREND
ncbi:MAG: 5-oxoprolinase subunit B family protein [Hyphomonas sp.]